MTEQSTTDETPRPDLAEFNLEEWVATGDAGRAVRARETVTVYRDPSLLDEARNLAQEITTLQAQDTGEGNPDATMGEADPVVELMRRQEELDEKIRASKAEVVVIALSDSEMEELEATHKQRYPAEKKSWDQTVKGTCLVLANAATINGAKLTADQWRGLSEGSLAGGQWEKVKHAWLVAQKKVPRADSPFSQSGYPRRTVG